MNKPEIQTSDVLYGREGAEGLPLSVATALSGELHASVRGKAVADGHAGDVKAHDAEAQQVAAFLHAHFNQSAAKEFVRTLSPWVQPFTDIRDDDSLAKSELAGVKALHAKYGMTDTGALLRDAQTALRRIVQAAPGLKRALIENGGANDPAVIEHLANLARRKRWK